jgi:hypothetical protein
LLPSCRITRTSNPFYGVHPRRSFVMAALFNFWLIVVQVLTAKRAV